jgi:photosystem II stability/assembly factor-like uncharacterized protein
MPPNWKTGVYLRGRGQSKGTAEYEDTLMAVAQKIAKIDAVRNIFLIPVIGAVAIGAGLLHAPADDPSWMVQSIGIQTNLRGISAAHSSRTDKTPVVWASGSSGVVIRSRDGGKTWQRIHVEGGDTLDFRGIQAISSDTAYLMASGTRDQSRIYKTGDGGQTWQLQVIDERDGFFLDAFVCLDEMRCFTLSDPVGGKFLVLATLDGQHWEDLPRATMPAALTGEGAFAAGNSALTVLGNSEIYFGTGGGATSRVFHSTDMGRTWTVTATPVAAGAASAGIFSIARSGDTVIAVGGDYRQANLASSVASCSTDRGATWQLAAPQPTGYRSAVASVDAKTFVTAGPNGEDISRDGCSHWTHSGSVNLNAITALDEGTVWGAGANGTVARYSVPQK